MAARRALFRPDALAGFGHLSRSLALATAWAASGGEVVVSAPGIDDRWRARFDALGASWDAGQRCEWCVLDGYGNDLVIQREARASHDRLLVIDDHGSLGSYEADLVLDHNVGAGPADYPGRTPDDLFGLRYLLLRGEFGPDLPPRPEPGRRVLLAPGGAPSTAASAAFEAAASVLVERGADVVWLRGTDDVAAIMNGADVAIAAAGVTAYELCRIGVPSVLVAVAANQEPVGRGLHDVGAAVYRGTLADVGGPELADAASALLDDPVRVPPLVDGHGAERVVAAMRSFAVDVRDAGADDADLTWRWANDPEVRAQSFETGPIPWDTHQRWFTAQLDEPSAAFAIAEVDGEAVGNVRFAPSSTAGTVTLGFSVAASHRGRGLAAPMLVAAMRRYRRGHPDRTVEALVKPTNTASARALDRAGFEPMGVQGDGALLFLDRARS